MPSTTNFGWTTPADTDLVKDGASAIRTLGNGIDTSFVDLKGGTTGQILAKNSNTDLDFTWIANDQGDITAVTAGTGISGGGTSGAVTITNSMATEITASGDIIVGTGSGTFDNLPIGTTGQVLTADTTVSPYKVKWAAAAAGGLTQISSTTLTGASITLSSIPSTYVDLYLVIQNYKPVNDADGLFMRVNGETGTSYRSFDARGNALPANGTSVRISQEQDNGTATGLSVNVIPNYANSTTLKFWTSLSLTNNGTNPSTQIEFQNSISVFYKTDAISSITLFSSTGNFTSGTAILYGVK